MKKNKKIDSKDEKELIGFIELLRSLVNINQKARLALWLAVVGTFLLKWVFKIYFPTGLFVTIFVFALTISGYYYILSKRVNKLRDLENAVTIYTLFNLVLYTAIIHYFGGIEGIGVLIYLFIIVEANIVLSGKKSILVTLFAVICYGTMGTLEYLGIIPHNDPFLIGRVLYNNPLHLLFSVVVGGLLGFFYTGHIASNFSTVYRKMGEVLKGEREILMNTQEQLEEAKTSLEIKVAARTRELQNLTENLEEEVKVRTEEALEKVKELEKFQKFSVGRELKMVELKQEIKKLKKELEQYKNK
jgi:uncharacterized membrane protein YfcA